MAKKVRKSYQEWMHEIDIASRMAALVMISVRSRNKKKLRRMVRVLFKQQLEVFPPPMPWPMRVMRYLRSKLKRAA